jgi:hypothetical protein
MEAQANTRAIGNMQRARMVRLEANRLASMSERLARLHALCKQMSAIKGAASAGCLTEALADLGSTLPTVKGRRFDSTTDSGVIRRGGT